MSGSSRPTAPEAAAGERLALALRENLRRRKRQQVLRARPGEEVAAPPGAAEPAADVEPDGEASAPADARRP